MTHLDKVIDKFFGNAETPIEWSSEAERKLHFWFDDLHCPQPISPMWFDVGGWWLTCGYMYRRFGIPFGKDWVAKRINGYVMSAVVPRDPKEAADLDAYFKMVMPVYGVKFVQWWQSRYVPEIRANFEFLDEYDMESAPLPELMVLLEDALDIQERHFRLHWILNLAQFQSHNAFQNVFNEIIGEEHSVLVGRILVSDEDRNWDSVRELWELKENAKCNDTIREAFNFETARLVMDALAKSNEGREFLLKLDAYKKEYGNKSIYTHEYLTETWRENPTPIIEVLRGYLASDYDYQADVRQLRENRDKAIAQMWSLFPKDRPEADRGRLRGAMELALKLAPLTPDHHFYMDQGTYARVRLVFMAIGRKMVTAGTLRQPDDVFYLKYEELRVISANPSAFDVKTLVKERRRERERAFHLRPPDWAGTITEWSLHGEPYKGHWGWPDVYTKSAERASQPKGTLRGLGASAGIVEGVARLVESPDQFDEVKKGEILVCKMTNPAWVLVFTKIAGLVTDSGGALSHPAVLSREFGIPAVVGTGVATQQISTGQRVRVNGAIGVVEILETPVLARK
jgi:phosphohistidine swiveling domain-containing protein